MHLRSYIRAAVSISLIILAGCGSSDEHEYKKGLGRLEKEDYKGAIFLFRQSILKNPTSQSALEAARAGAKIALFELKEFNTAIDFHKFIVLQSENSSERVESQKQITNIYFDNLNDYEKVIYESNKLLPMLKSKDEIIKAKMNLARSYFYMSNFIQAESETAWVLNNSTDEEISFQAMVLKGNIQLAKKDLNKASEIFQTILKKHPEKAVKENVATTLAVSYEELKDYKSAISVLEAIKPLHPMPEYIELRIKRLKDNQKQQPGAKGLRRK